MKYTPTGSDADSTWKLPKTGVPYAMQGGRVEGGDEGDEQAVLFFAYLRIDDLVSAIPERSLQVGDEVPELKRFVTIGRDAQLEEHFAKLSDIEGNAATFELVARGQSKGHQVTMTTTITVRTTDAAPIHYESRRVITSDPADALATGEETEIDLRYP